MEEESTRSTNGRDEICSEYLIEKFSWFVYTYVLHVFYILALKDVQCIYDKQINAIYLFFVQALKNVLYLFDKPTDANMFNHMLLFFTNMFCSLL